MRYLFLNSLAHFLRLVYVWTILTLYLRVDLLALSGWLNLVCQVSVGSPSFLHDDPLHP
jgi:hypothetical protein